MKSKDLLKSIRANDDSFSSLTDRTKNVVARTEHIKVDDDEDCVDKIEASMDDW